MPRSTVQTPAPQVAAKLLHACLILGACMGLTPMASQASALSPAASQVGRGSAADVVMTAMAFLGLPYVRAGQSADEGFDCSGFTRHVVGNSLGLWLPRRAEEQASHPAWTPVAQEHLRPGDLVFFNTLRRSFSHVGIYAGEGRFIHAPRPGSAIRLEDMRKAYWTHRYNGARRAGVLMAAPGGAPATAAVGGVKPAAAAPGGNEGWTGAVVTNLAASHGPAHTGGPQTDTMP